MKKSLLQITAALLLLVSLFLLLPAAVTAENAAANGKKATVTVSPALAPVGSSVTFTVKTNVKKSPKIQWQVSTDKGKTWKKLQGKTKSTLKVKVKEETYSSLYRCVVNPGETQVASKPVSVGNPYKVSVSAPAEVAEGKTKSFTAKVKAVSKDVPLPAKSKIKYAWQYSTDNGKNWVAASEDKGHGKQKITLTGDDAHYRRLYRCRIKVGKNVLYTDSIYVDPAAAKNFTLKEGKSQWTVTGYRGSDKNVKVPAGYHGKKITVIGEGAFQNTKIGKVTLPDTLTRIESKAFAGSTLTAVNLPKSLKFIAEDAFSGANSLSLVTGTKGSNYAYTWGRKHGLIREYRALLIGQVTFINVVERYGQYYYDFDYAERNHGDVVNMKAMLGRVSGGYGGPFAVTTKIDVSAAGVKKLIQSTFSGAMAQDVCLFFIATHGDSSADGELAMPYLGGRDSEEVLAYLRNPDRFVPFSSLASWLKSSCKGEVVVIIESCGSGSAIYSKDEQQNAAGSSGKLLPVDALSGLNLSHGAFSEKKFVSQAVSAFEKADSGVKSNWADKVLSNSTGDLRLPKFYVLAASRHHELSWGNSEENYFTRWLIQGVGKKGRSPADTSNDGILTLTELFNYIKKFDSYPFEYEGQTYYQHVQRYPAGSKYRVFRFP